MRKVSLWLAPVVAAAAIMALTLGGVAQASKHVSSSPVRGAAAKVRPNNPTTGKLLKNNIVANGFSGAATVSGFNNVDSPHNIICPATKAPCQIEMIAMIQFDSGAGGGAPGANAVCLLVDGGTYNTCPYMNAGGGNGFFTADTATGYVQVAAGTHTVQTQLYVAGSSTIYNYDIAYHEYG
jgi:hypothetical protein